MKNAIVYLNGKFVKLQNAQVSILDRGFNYGDGLFETMRAYAGNVFCLDLHLDRLFYSAKSILLNIPLKHEELSSIILKTLNKNSYTDAYVRLTVTRGSAPPGLLIDSSAPPTVVVYVQPLGPIPQKWYRRGVSVSLFPSTATKTSGLQTQVKSCDFLSRIIVREMAVRENSYEGILLEGKNKITEGTTSNIFLVKDGALKTPRLSPAILPGITRRVVLDIARKKMPCFEQALTRHDLYQCDEAFLTNSMIEVVPVTHADGQKIGNGKPGRTTRLLHKAYSKMTEQAQS